MSGPTTNRHAPKETVDMKAFRGQARGFTQPRSAQEPPALRRTLPPGAAYALVAAVVGLSLFASGIPSPLYGTYQALWGFSPIVLTLVYATYAGGVLVALIVAGRVSDEIGRRPVLLLALAALMGSAIMFVLADSVAWLFAARAVQGLATGLALGAASAALLELHPRRDPAAVGLTNGVVSAGGLGLGVLVSSVLVQPAPRPAGASVRVAVPVVRDRLCGRGVDARAGREALSSASRTAASGRSTQCPPSVPAGFTGRHFLMVACRSLPVAGTGVGRQLVSYR
jgi:hypothetical protein